MKTLQARLAALRSPESYPEHPARVEAIETHKSWVFLTDRHAYKLKKPVLFNLVDHRDLESRRATCRNEVRLNRRLAEEVYLGAVPLTGDPDDRIRVSGEGEVIDWLVKMRRLPAEKMLDRMIEEERASREDVRRVAQRLARFYRDEEPVEIGAGEYRDGIASELAVSNEAFTSRVEGRIGIEGTPTIERLLAALHDHAELFDERVSAGRIVEGHGDLRPEHVCVIDPEPVVIDCLEFDRRLRLVDPLDELGFLSLECERIGAGWVGPILLKEYERLTGDRGHERLMSFYKAYRATTWARLAVWRLGEDGVTDPEKWVRRAREYLELARSYERGSVAA